MSTPPPHPGSTATATADRPAPPDVPAGPPEPRGAKFGTHQVLWGLGGLMVGLATGILGTAAESPAPAAAAPAPAVSAPAAPTAAAAARPALTGTTMAGAGLFRIGPDLRAGEVRAGTWRTAGAVGGPAGSCYVALLHRPGATSVISSQIVTGPAVIVTTARTRAIRTSGCQPWHRVPASGAAAARADRRAP